MSEKVYLYESHLNGTIFTSKEPLDWDEMYCEECGDSDTEIGDFTSFKEFYESIVNNERYFNKNRYDPFKHTEWNVSEYWLADAINTLVAYWNYPFEEIKLDRYNNECNMSYQDLMNKAYEICMYEDKRFCYEIECLDGDVYYVEMGIMNEILDLYPPERKLDFSYNLIERSSIEHSDTIMDHVPVCFWDEYRHWEETSHVENQ